MQVDADGRSAMEKKADIGAVCFLCGSDNIINTKYLMLNSQSITRNLAYAMPVWVGDLLSRLSARLEKAYRPVRVNKRYFDRAAVYCKCCLTGRVIPMFVAGQLAEYYRSFYWGNRDLVDGHHVPLEDRPNSRQLALARDRIEWLGQFKVACNSIVDFGAGDCSAAYAFLQDGAGLVHVVDPSDRARALAGKYGASYSAELADAPAVDLVYSAHSLEHVADLKQTLRDIVEKTKAGGHIFFETPNVGDAAVFMGLCHTPHTYMLSEASFRTAISDLPVRMVAAERSGPEWRVSHPGIASAERADLRILLQRSDASMSGA